MIDVGGDVGFTHSPTLSSSLGEVHSFFSDWMPPRASSLLESVIVADCFIRCVFGVARLAPYLSSRLPF